LSGDNNYYLVNIPDYFLRWRRKADEEIMLVDKSCHYCTVYENHQAGKNGATVGVVAEKTGLVWIDGQD